MSRTRAQMWAWYAAAWIPLAAMYSIVITRQQPMSIGQSLVRGVWYVLPVPLLGVGGGFVIIPALTRYTNLDSKSIVATSLAVIALVSTGSVITASLSGVMHWAVGAPFAGGAVLGLIAGRQVARYLAGPRLQQLFALVGMLAAVMLSLGALGAWH